MWVSRIEAVFTALPQAVEARTVLLVHQIEQVERMNKHRPRRSKFLSGSFCDKMAGKNHTSCLDYVKMGGLQLSTVCEGCIREKNRLNDQRSRLF
jgi:hypothetical protein